MTSVGTPLPAPFTGCILPLNGSMDAGLISLSAPVIANDPHEAQIMNLIAFLNPKMGLSKNHPNIGLGPTKLELELTWIP